MVIRVSFLGTFSLGERYVLFWRKIRFRCVGATFLLAFAPAQTGICAYANDHLRMPKQPFAPTQTTVRVGANHLLDSYSSWQTI